MTEIVARLPRPRRPLPLLAALLVTLAAGSGVLTAALVHDAPHAPASSSRTAAPPRTAPAASASRGAAPEEPLPTGLLERKAAHGLDRGFFFGRRSVLEVARQVTVHRGLVLRATSHALIGPKVLEALVYVESGGEAGAVAGNRAGLTQLSPGEARRSGLRVNGRRSRRLTREIALRLRHRDRRAARRLARHRARIDWRFRPEAELRATAHLLDRRLRRLGRLDLALASLHLGTRSILRAERLWGNPEVSYAQLYFGSAPNRRRPIYRLLNAHGEPAHDYVWHVLTAERLLRLARAHPGRLAWEDRQQHRKNSAEEVLHPRAVTHEFRNPKALARAWRRHAVRWIPNDPARTHVRLDRLGAMAHAVHARRRLYRGLRPDALDVLLLIGRKVHALAGGTPLELTSAVRDDRYQAALTGVNAFATPAYSLHTTGYAFDLGRGGLTRRQAHALRWALNRLTALDAVAYIEEPYCFHVAVSSRAGRELGLLRRALGTRPAM